MPLDSREPIDAILVFDEPPALLLNHHLPFKAFFRAIVLLPYIVPTALSAIAFWWIYHSQFSVISWVLVKAGLIDRYIDFLGDPWNARLSTIAANVWRGVPFVAITLLAGLQTISPSYYEAASLDGASPWQQFRHVTLPLLTPIIARGDDVLGAVHVHRLPADLRADARRAAQRDAPDGHAVVPARHSRRGAGRGRRARGGDGAVPARGDHVGGSIANDGSAAQLWNAETGQRLRDFKGHTDAINYGVAFSPDGKHLVTASWDTTVRLWDTQTGAEVQQFVGHTALVNSVVFSPDGRFVLTAGQDAVRLWDVESGQQIRRIGEIDTVYRAAFSPDGKYILTSAGRSDDKVRLWDVSTGKLIQEYQSAMPGTDSVAFSPDGKIVIDYGVNMWDMQTGKELRRLIGHTDGIWTATFSPNGKYIATASADGTARLWDVQSGQELRRFTGHSAGVQRSSESSFGSIGITLSGK